MQHSLPLGRFVMALFFASSPVVAQCKEGKLVPAAGDFGAQMGTAVSIAGDHAILGAPYDNLAGSLTGAVHFFERVGGEWGHVQKLTASDVADRDRLGFSVDIDGDYAITGSRYDEDAGYATGSAYVFQRQGAVWVESAKLLADDMAGESFFGHSVAIIDEGLAVVGAHGEDSADVNAGAVYLFQETAGVWSQIAKLTASDALDSDQFGWSLSLSGHTLFVGARGRDDFGPASGAVYVFEQSGGVWSETQKLLASDGATPARFGVSVSVDGDGAVIGASFDPEAGSDAGAAYIFERQGGQWVETSKLTAADAMPGDFFGSCVSVSGELVAIGAFGADDVADNGGAAYVYERGIAGWTQNAKVAPSSLADGDNLGFAAAVEDGALLLPARGDDTLVLDAGALYAFTSRDLHMLEGSPAEVSLSAGGQQDFAISTCPSRPGAFYFVLGTASGVDVGFDAGDFHMPLNVDFYLILTLQNPNFYPLPASSGFLDGSGLGTARFELDAGESPGLAGLTIHHAYGLIDTDASLLRQASNTVPVTLVP